MTGLAALMVMAAGALVVASPAVAGVANVATSWHGQATNLAGYSQMSKGEMIYTDYLYDDFGPNLDGKDNPTPYRPTGQDSVSGDYTYPAGPQYAGDGADLRELRLKLDPQGLHARVAFQTMVDASVPIATIAIDADGDAATGAGVWAGGAGTTTPGADHFITVWGGGATWTAGGRARPIPHATDTTANTFQVTVPDALLGNLSNNARVWVGVGLSAGGGDYVQPSPGHTALFDIGFQGAETYTYTSSWGDKRQAAALASGNLSAFAGRFDAGASARGANRLMKLKPGYYNRIFRSNFSYGEGVDLAPGDLFGGSAPEFLGRYQPYGFYVPPGYDPKKKTPLLLLLHALNKNQNLFASVSPNSYTQLGADRHSLVVTPLARATDGWYLDAGLIDTMEAWKNAARTYNADPDRTSVLGYSMGGYGTYRLGLLMPDRFARASVYVGPPVYAYWKYPRPPVTPEAQYKVAGNTSLLVDNALNLPFEMNYGGADPIVPISGGLHQVDLFRAAGDAYRVYSYPKANHFTLAAQDQWAHTAKWLGSYRRVKNPVEVRYVRYPAMDVPADGLTFDSAYWVSHIEVRSDTAPDSHGEVVAVTDGLGQGKRPLVPEPPSTYTPPDPATEDSATVSGRHLGPAPKAKPKNSFEVSLVDLASVQLDLGRMGLDPQRRLTAQLKGDGTTVLELQGGWSRRPAVTLDGHQVPVTRRGRVVSVSLDLPPGGQHELVISPG